MRNQIGKWIVFGVVIIVALRSHGQQATYTPEELHTFFQREAQSYAFSPKELQLIEKPVLHWSNPVRRQEQGGLYIWTEDGRPAVMVSIFSFLASTDRVRYRHEVLSLTDYPMEAKLDGRLVWQPSANPDDFWKELANVPSPAPSATRRLVQMRGIARRFSGEKTEFDDKVVKLKLMPQPVFRYVSTKKKVLDGAIFGIVEATDPEIFLMIEAFTDEDGAKRWRYAIKQSHFLDMKVYLNGDEVWSNDLNRTLMGTREGQMPYAGEPYFAFYCRNLNPPPPEELRSSETDGENEE